MAYQDSEKHSLGNVTTAEERLPAVIRTMPIGPVSWETGNWRWAGRAWRGESLGVGCEPRRRRAD
jgi:hypothetical protein